MFWSMSGKGVLLMTQCPAEKGSTDAQANGGSVRDGLDQAAAGRRSTTAVHP